MKRRLRMLILVLILSAASFRVPASAVAGSNSAATRADFTATVDIDGNCLVTMQMSLHLDKEEELSLRHISEPTRRTPNSYDVFGLIKKVRVRTRLTKIILMSQPVNLIILA